MQKKRIAIICSYFRDFKHIKKCIENKYPDIECMYVTHDNDVRGRDWLAYVLGYIDTRGNTLWHLADKAEDLLKHRKVQKWTLIEDVKKEFRERYDIQELQYIPVELSDREKELLALCRESMSQITNMHKLPAHLFTQNNTQ